MFSEMKRTDPSPMSMLQPPREGPPMPSGPLMYGFLINGRMVDFPPCPQGPKFLPASLTAIEFEVPSLISRIRVTRLYPNIPARL